MLGPFKGPSTSRRPQHLYASHGTDRCVREAADGGREQVCVCLIGRSDSRVTGVWQPGATSVCSGAPDLPKASIHSIHSHLLIEWHYRDRRERRRESFRQPDRPERLQIITVSTDSSLTSPREEEKRRGMRGQAGRWEASLHLIKRATQCSGGAACESCRLQPWHWFFCFWNI